MGTRKKQEVQEEFWVARAALPTGAGHPFYQRLNQLLEENGFDRFIEDLCPRFYAHRRGRPSLAPGVYFRLLLLGYFEGIDSERGMAWWASDSLGLRRFLRIGLEEGGPDHSTISRARRRIDVETHREVFVWVLRRVAESGRLKGQTVGIDATTLEANAALRSIVRRDTGEGYQEFLQRLAKESGIATPTREELAQLDRKRPHKGSSQDWEHPYDRDARITKMKDGRTHLAHKAEHAVDMQSGEVVAVTIQPADRGDTDTLKATLAEAREVITAVAAETSGPEAGEPVKPPRPAVVLDKGYHSNEVPVGLKQAGVRSYGSEPERGRRSWEGKRAEQAAVYANRRRVRGRQGKELLRQRGEKVERSFAHAYETGAMRRVHLRRHSNILKRLLVQVAAFNLGLVMRKMLGKGTPRGFQDRRAGLLAGLAQWLTRLGARPEVLRSFLEGLARGARWLANPQRLPMPIPNFATSTTGC